MCLGVPGKVVDVFERDGIRMGTVDFGGIRREACLAFEPDVGVGSYVVIHVGFAISVVDEEEAARSYALLAEMDNLENIDLPQDPEGVRRPEGTSANARTVGPRGTGVRG
jgi:hydrogenase expression/formation protein HypC